MSSVVARAPRSGSPDDHVVSAERGHCLVGEVVRCVSVRNGGTPTIHLDATRTAGAGDSCGSELPAGQMRKLGGRRGRARDDRGDHRCERQDHLARLNDRPTASACSTTPRVARAPTSTFTWYAFRASTTSAAAPRPRKHSKLGRRTRMSFSSGLRPCLAPPAPLWRSDVQPTTTTTAPAAGMR